MAVRQYIGARYVPIFGRKGEQSIQWDNTGTYEPLTVVLYQGNSYTSRQFVPVGIDITNQDYWAETGNYNAQVEQYRQEVLGFQDAIDQNASNIADLNDQMDGTSPSALKTAIDANADAIDTHSDQLAGTEPSGLSAAIDMLANQMAGTEPSALKTAIDANSDAIDTQSDQLAGTEPSGLGTKIDDVTELASRLIIGGTVMPAYIGSFVGDEQNSACVRVGNDIYTLSVNNYDGMGTVRIWNLTGNTLVSSRQVLLGHGNSVAYDSVRECIWVAPMRTYVAGVGTDTNVIYRYNMQFTSRIEMTCAERIYGISFDPVTRTLYAFAATNETEQVRIYTMREDESEFTLRYTITNAQFAYRGYTGILYWQDFAVYDSHAIMAWSDGTCYVVDLTAENPSVTGTLHISHTDAGSLWRYGELEGIEFDANGRLYAMQQCDCGFRNAGQNWNHSVGFVTEINTQHTISLIDSNLMNVYGSVTLVSSTVFGLGRSEVHSPNELIWRNDLNYSKVIVPAGTNFTFDRIRVMKDLTLDVQGSLTINDRIEISSGNFFLYLEGGTIRFNTPAGNHCINSATRSGMFSIRSSGGHLENANDANLFNAGYTPMLVCISVLDNINSVKINNVERGPNTFCMGSYEIWSRT